MEAPSLSRISQDSRPDALREEERRRGSQDAFHPQGTRRVTIFVTLVARSSLLVTRPLWEVALQSRRRAFVSVS